MILQRSEASVEFWILRHSHQTNGELGSGLLRHCLQPHHHLLYICSNIFECIFCAVLGVFSCIIFSFDLVVISNDVILGIFNYSWMVIFFTPRSRNVI